MTDDRPSDLSTKLSHILQCMWQPKTKASMFTSKDSTCHTKHSYFLLFSCGSKPGSFSKPLCYLPHIHSKYRQKWAILPLACPRVILWYFREYSKNWVKFYYLTHSKWWWMNGLMYKLFIAKGLESFLAQSWDIFIATVYEVKKRSLGGKSIDLNSSLSSNPWGTPTSLTELTLANYKRYRLG